MKGEVALTTVPVEEKSVLSRLLQQYLRELSEFDNLERDPHSRISYPYFDLYWKESERHPFFIWVDDRLAGFALVRSGKRASFAEFFVLPSERRAGVGTKAARKLFGRFPGHWEVRQMRNNLLAQEFWKRVISEYAATGFTEFVADDGDLIQHFESGEQD